jgi:alkylation response protein AidB-like acyl-CoA dehydrogenase
MSVEGQPIHDLTIEQKRLVEEAKAFTAEKVLPLANELDPKHEDVPWDLVDSMAELGYFGIVIDKQHGGLGLGNLEYCLVSEELSRGWMSVASVIARANRVGTNVADPGWRDELLSRQAAGKAICAGAFSEPEAGSDLAAASTRAVLDGDEYVINGTKRWCGWAKKADFIILMARTSDDRRGGLDLFYVDKERGEFPPGISGTPIPKIGYFGITSYALEINDLRVPASHLMVDADGRTGTGFAEFATLINWGRLHTAARAVGAARGALEDATAYAKSRVQFGKPIAGFQGIKFKLADMATSVEAARHLYRYAARLLDDGQPCNKECSMAKLYASEMAEEVASSAMQILGGNGYTTEYAVERHWRDARLTQIFEGTSEIQRTLIARDQLAGNSR